jgi:hypothetical protein
VSVPTDAVAVREHDDPQHHASHEAGNEESTMSKEPNQPIEPETDDAEGHRRHFHVDEAGAEDTEGHRGKISRVAEAGEDDTEGHKLHRH